MGPNGVLGLGETGKGNELGESELTGPPWPTWFTPFGEGVPSGAYQDSTLCSGPFGEGGTSPELTAPLPRAQDHSAKVLRTVRRGGTVRSLPRLYLVLRTVGSGDENQQGVPHLPTDRAKKYARAGLPTPCPLSLAAGWVSNSVR